MSLHPLPVPRTTPSERQRRKAPSSGSASSSGGRCAAAAAKCNVSARRGFRNARARRPVPAILSTFSIFLATTSCLPKKKLNYFYPKSDESYWHRAGRGVRHGESEDLMVTEDTAELFQVGCGATSLWGFWGHRDYFSL